MRPWVAAKYGTNANRPGAYSTLIGGGVAAATADGDATVTVGVAVAAVGFDTAAVVVRTAVVAAVAILGRLAVGGVVGGASEAVVRSTALAERAVGRVPEVGSSATNITSGRPVGMDTDVMRAIAVFVFPAVRDGCNGGGGVARASILA